MLWFRMHQREDESNWQVGTLIGWCILFASLTPLVTAAILVGTLGSGMQSGGSLLLLTLPTPVLMLVAGVGLVMRKSFGYWSAYLATFFGGIGGLKIPFLPLLQTYVKLGPETGLLFLVLNLFIVALLAWEHWGRLNKIEWKQRKRRRFGLILLLIAGTGSVTFGVMMEPIKKGVVLETSQLPVVSGYFEQLSPKAVSEKGQVVHYVVVHNQLHHSVEAVVSGGAEEDAIRSLAQHHGLKSVEKPEAFRKILPLAKRWKLDERFTRDFAPPDLLFVGRPRDGSKAVIQIAWRQRDQRFTAEMFGSIIPDAPPASAN